MIIKIKIIKKMFFYRRVSPPAPWNEHKLIHFLYINFSGVRKLLNMNHGIYPITQTLNLYAHNDLHSKFFKTLISTDSFWNPNPVLTPKTYFQTHNGLLSTIFSYLPVEPCMIQFSTSAPLITKVNNAQFLPFLFPKSTKNAPFLPNLYWSERTVVYEHVE